MSEKENKDNQAEGSKPGWVKAIEENPQDITKHLYEMFSNSEFKTNIEEDLKKAEKKSE